MRHHNANASSTRSSVATSATGRIDHQATITELSRVASRERAWEIRSAVTIVVLASLAVLCSALPGWTSGIVVIFIVAGLASFTVVHRRFSDTRSALKSLSVTIAQQIDEYQKQRKTTKTIPLTVRVVTNAGRILTISQDIPLIRALAGDTSAQVLIPETTTVAGTSEIERGFRLEFRRFGGGCRVVMTGASAGLMLASTLKVSYGYREQTFKGRDLVDGKDWILDARNDNIVSMCIEFDFHRCSGAHG